MKPDHRARFYARALLKVAREKDAVADVGQSLSDVAEFLRREPLFRVLFHTRRISAPEKATLLRDTLQRFVHPIVLEFIAILGDKRETILFPQVVKQYLLWQQDALNQVPLTVFTAEKLSETTFTRIVDRLAATSGKQVDAREVVDPTLLGGIKVRLGNLYLDASLARQLDHLRATLLK
ncbi:MAG: ATP synthase F1 subunit delta [Candidatus Neomarinimicrobiota bacterium]|nr:MAG: ATP synthase F1 subunit delta [Candidatus Neomarinimicrobiota bacterium]